MEVACADALISGSLDTNTVEQYRRILVETGPEQVIVDLPALKAEAIRILAWYPTGAIKVPEFSYVFRAFL